MADVDQLFHAYVAEHKSGGDADPREFLAKVDGGDRSELAALIDTYLARSPGREWNSDAFEGSPAQLAADRIFAEWELEEGGEVEAQGWRELLPALRNRAQLRRRELVDRLAEGIGHPGETQRVSAYYHQMEIGKLPAEGVSNRVLQVLSEIVGESAERLRAAGSVVVPGGETQSDAMAQVAFARTAAQDPRYKSRVEPPMADVGITELGAAPPPDDSEVDRLFTGGPDAG